MVAAHSHQFTFDPLLLPVAAMSLELAYDGPNPIEIRRRRADDTTEVAGYRPGLLSHLAFTPTESPGQPFALQASCACGTRLEYGPFQFKELQCYLAGGSDLTTLIRQVSPEESE